VPDLAERSIRWADLGIRAVSALVLAPIALACVWLGGIAFAVIVVATAVGLAVEWLRLLQANRRRAEAGAALERDERGSMHSPRSSSPLSRVIQTSGDSAFGHHALRVAGFGYVLLAAAALLWLRSDPVAGRSDVLFLLCVVWSNDISAYLLGRWIGGPRLAPRISPGKTWSGAAGGLVAAVAVGLLAAHVLSDTPPWGAIPVAAVLGVVAQGGDLLESFVKRRLEVKDSGHLIPGHGGLFDRLDALLAATPVAALLALILGRGVVLWQ
jgi:phosphatidate cytidylyltransferase